MAKSLLNLLFSMAIITASSVSAQTKVQSMASGVPQHDPPVTRPLDTTIGEGRNNTGFDMAPETHKR